MIILNVLYYYGFVMGEITKKQQQDMELHLYRQRGNMELFNLVDSVVINKIARDKSGDYYNEIRGYSQYMLDSKARDIFNSGNACMELFRMFIAEVKELYENKYQALGEEMYNEYVKKYKAYVLEESEDESDLISIEELEDDCDDDYELYNPELDTINPEGNNNHTELIAAEMANVIVNRDLDNDVWPNDIDVSAQTDDEL